MGFIKTDPSQTKTVVALLGILGVAIGVTVIRINPAPQQATQAAAAQAQAGSAAKSDIEDDVIYDRSRNPFKRPAMLPASPARSGGPHFDRQGPWADSGSVRVQPITVAPMPGFGGESPKAAAPARADGQANANKADAKPTFDLLATMSGGQGFSAVIRCGGKVRVVEVGDILDGGYKVCKLDNGQAVLSDGRNTLVAKRPRS